MTRSPTSACGLAPVFVEVAFRVRRLRATMLQAAGEHELLALMEPAAAIVCSDGVVGA